MFPNPQSALPLSPNPNLDRYKKIAKDLVKACKSGSQEALHHWAAEWVHDLIRLSDLQMTSQLPIDVRQWIEGVDDFARRTLLGSETTAANCTLAAAHFVIARSHGFDSWPKFAKHLRALAQHTSTESRFEAAADAIVEGDAATLKPLLAEEPRLTRARSTRKHGATLLHYVSANGVEGYRQKTPMNIVAMTKLLLEAGAEINATAHVYGHECTTLGLAATSVHPERAGIQQALLQTLLKHGATLDEPPEIEMEGADRRISIVTSSLENGRLKAAEFLAASGAPLDLAAASGLGRLDVVKTFFAEDGSLGQNATPNQLQQGLFFACQYGHSSIVEFLIEKGADLAAAGNNGQTALHWAVIGGHPETVKLLLKYRPPLEATNSYGGTVLGQALWSAAHNGDPVKYRSILEALVEAGATLPRPPRSSQSGDR
jgi:hypothetical protein